MPPQHIPSEDVMDLTRDDSSTTLDGDSCNSNPRLENTIDLDALDQMKGFHQDDYMTEEDFQAFLSDRKSKASDLQGTNVPPMRSIQSFSTEGKTYRKGKTVESHNGDFLRITSVLEDTKSKEVFLEGYPLKRLSKVRGIFEQHLNEVVMLKEQNCYGLPSPGISTERLPLSNVSRIRNLIFTNAPFPSYSCREDPTSSKQSREYLREHGSLICRWKMTISFRPHTTRRRVWFEKCIERITLGETDTGFGLDELRLRRRFRGSTAKGGSCADWLPGEKEFDEAECIESQAGRSSGHRYTFGDAFCGAGGASRAAKAAGLRVDWGFDFEPTAIDSYKRNFFATRCEATPADVFISSISEIFQVDVLHLSPSCQPYSPLHTRPGRNDEMNQATFFAVGEIIKKTKPRMVVLENTFGLVDRWPEWLDAMVQFFTTLGFSLRWRVLNLAEYGLPQARRRLVVFASCPGERLPEYPQPTHGPGRLPFATVNDAISGIPQNSPNHSPQNVAKRNHPPYNSHLPLKNCITTAGSLDIHPNGQRSFTDRELACLQGFPLEHTFGPTKVKTQIGNAVPPLVFRVFFSHIRQALEQADGMAVNTGHASEAPNSDSDVKAVRDVNFDFPLIQKMTAVSVDHPWLKTPTMTTEPGFKELQGKISSALVKTTRTAGQIASDDLAFHRSINPEVDRLLDEQNKRLLALARDLNKSATAGTSTSPPQLTNLESVEDGWRDIVDVVDSLLERADACLDEFSGVIKKLAPSRQDEPSTANAKRLLSEREYRFQNIPKPQRLFNTVPKNDETTPFKPLLQLKPNAAVPLQDSLVTAIGLHGSTHYKHPYETEIAQSTYPDPAFVQSDPIPYLPFESTTAIWVDTPEAVQDMLQHLKAAKEIAVDLEHHDLHSYVGLVSLMQISTREKDWIVDTLVPWREDLQVLNEVFTDPRIIKVSYNSRSQPRLSDAVEQVFHGSNCDIVWLQRDLGLYVVSLFDTYHASKLLGYPRHGLAHLLQRFTDYVSDKRYQMADWRMRPLPQQMFDYARSDTHFLLFIYDNMRNELLMKSDITIAHGNLINNVHELSKAEALQRYERNFYDLEAGYGANGWNSLLKSTPGTFTRDQFAVYRAIHAWRDAVARTEDESINHILSNQALATIAREMPTEPSALLRHARSSHSVVKNSVSNLSNIIAKARVQGANGPNVWDLVKPRSHAHKSLAVADLAKDIHKANERAEQGESMTKITPASLSTSRFWGGILQGMWQSISDSKIPRRSDEPCLALPLPPLTAEIFETQGLNESSISAHETNDPGTRAKHRFLKKRKDYDEDVFVIKQFDGSKKRKPNEMQGGPEPIPEEDQSPRADCEVRGEVERLEIPLDDAEDKQAALEQRKRKQERKAQKKVLKEQKRQEELQQTNGEGNARMDGREMEAFDYENAPSVLHAQKEMGRQKGGRKGFDPYAKSLNAPKGMRKVQKEGPGRSMTYQS
ncbi:MAG: hypothetical protein Q9228_002674 [Teloschistes exilis]